MPSRGPNDMELALDRCTRSKVALLEAAEVFRKALDEERKADEEAVRRGVTPPRLPLDRVTYAAWQVNRGVAFWNRDTAEPTPIRRTA